MYFLGDSFDNDSRTNNNDFKVREVNIILTYHCYKKSNRQELFVYVISIPILCR